MGPEDRQLHVFLFPFMAHGHMIPFMDMARQFALRGVKVTIVTTPLNAILLSKTVDRDRELGIEIDIHSIPFPTKEAGLPEGCENVNSITTPELSSNFFKALNMLQQPFQKLLEEHHPDCIVADMFFPWTTDFAGKLGIPRLVFHGSCFFSSCVPDSISRYAPHNNVSSETETFVVPGLPDPIEMTKSQLPDHMKIQNDFTRAMEQIKEAEVKSYGVVMNSFYELEPAYAEHYRKVMGRRAWHIGPLSLYNREKIGKAAQSRRGNTASIDENECLTWLDSKEPDSVLYVCFGSGPSFSTDQLVEIAMGLEASGHAFIWVVRKDETSAGSVAEVEPWLPQGFEDRVGSKGLIIRGWAPQVLILQHHAIGGFVTHCGWNSLLESVCVGVPLITWPVTAEQFYNEKLVTQVLRIGVPVGVQHWNSWLGKREHLVKREEIKKAVTRLMDGGDEAAQMKGRVKELKEMAKRAIDQNGSSDTDFTSLINELKLHRDMGDKFDL
ncbi:PREDICTED: scopoletin glucosyltransferase-like [Nelumbo nucifera]|uniref:Glycosyltransferase n=2 Tax=Nelumbo nucifera TaxID=4432 RepID=A0A822XN62_NELNU|nr:PREDICTED: scopoletin glucosyltransferase-like [Nelumbo nucifera]DAD21482.1 TPA_asm: hypothetical protein HUJ06_022945 [Nelumbo nucifera]